MPEEFTHDVFLSHSSKGKTVVREIAQRLREAGLRPWFDEWVLKAGDSIPAKFEEGLEHSRVLVLCMSANAFESDWAPLACPAVASERRRKAGTCVRGNFWARQLAARDPLNKERRFLPLRLDDAPIKGALAQFLYINNG